MSQSRCLLSSSLIVPRRCSDNGGIQAVGLGDTISFPYDDFQSLWVGGMRTLAPDTVA